MSLNDLPALGNLSYGDIDFDNNASVQSSISSRAVQDDSRRVTKYVEHTITIRGFLAIDSEGVTPDEAIDQYKEILTTPGLRLVFKDRGFGHVFDVNGDTGLKDVAYGPLPELLAWAPIGAANAVQFEWRVTTCIPEFNVTAPRCEGIITYNYTWSVSIDDDGYSTQTTTGWLEVAANRKSPGSRNISNTADSKRLFLKFKPPLGFRRKQDWRLSTDKRRLDWTIVDTQVPSALPPNVTTADVEHTVSTGLMGGRGFINWNATLSGTITMQPGVSKAEVWGVILLLITSRCFTGLLGKNPTTKLTPSAGAVYLPMEFRLTDQMFGRSSSFSFSYRIIGMTLEEILKKSGLWKPIPTATAKSWRDSLLPGAWHERGHAQLWFDEKDDILLDLGERGSPKLPDDRPVKLPGAGLPKIAPPVKPVIPPNGGWLWYEIYLRASSTVTVATHKPVAGNPQVTPARPPGFQNWNPWFIPGGAQQHTLQNQGPPRYEAVLHGRAARLFHFIDLPTLISVGDMKVGPGDNDIKIVKIEQETSQPGQALLGLPVNAMTWSITYLLPRAPTVKDPIVVTNPLFGITGIGGGAAPPAPPAPAP